VLNAGFQAKRIISHKVSDVPDPEVLPEEVLALRQSLKWSQAKFADHLGVAQSTVCRLERGDLRVDGPVRKLLGKMLSEQALA
jgi:DNA-binding transcriptional regulator YiaG